MPAATSPRSAPARVATRAAQGRAASARGRACREDAPGSIMECQPPAGERRERFVGVEDVAIAHVVRDVQRRGEEQRIRQEQRDRDQRMTPAAARPARRACTKIAGNDAAVEEHAEPVHRERLPVGERRAQARGERCRRGRVLEHDERRRPPRRDHDRQREQRGEQHAELQPRVGEARGKLLLAERAAAGHEVEQLAAVDERRCEHRDRDAGDEEHADREQRAAGWRGSPGTDA